MYWDRFDIVTAHYLFYRDYHGGQWSTEYARLCKIRTYFSAPLLLERAYLTDNAREIYDALVADQA